MRTFSFTPDQRLALIEAAYYFLNSGEKSPKRAALKNALIKLRKKAQTDVNQSSDTERKKGE